MKLAMFFNVAATLAVVNAHIAKRQLVLSSSQDALLGQYFDLLAAKYATDKLSVVDEFDVKGALDVATSAIIQIFPNGAVSSKARGISARYADVTCTIGTTECDTCHYDIRTVSDAAIKYMIEATAACVLEASAGFALACIPSYAAAVAAGEVDLGNFCAKYKQKAFCKEDCSWFP